MEQEKATTLLGKRWLTYQEAAAYTGYKVKYLANLVYKSKMPKPEHPNGGRHALFDRFKLDAWIMGEQYNPQQPNLQAIENNSDDGSVQIISESREVKDNERENVATGSERVTNSKVGKIVSDLCKKFD